MRIILHSRSFYFLGAALLIGTVLFFLFSFTHTPDTDMVTTTVTRGTVEEVVAVSGVVEARNTATLGFPVSGTVDSVLVDEGDVIQVGDTLATLVRRSLEADLADASAALTAARADLEELLSGPTSETRNVSETTVTNKQTDLARTITEENEKVANAYRTLLSDDIEAVADDGDESATPPTITGTYNCQAEGTYTLTVYNSSAKSGYSYSYRGLERGNGPARIDQPAALGACGLRIQFDEGSVYGNSQWTIAVPNTNSASYVTNLNTYELALERRDDAIADAESALALAQRQAAELTADPRTEAVTRAEAAIAQAQAKRSRISAQIADHVLTAPFGGTITNVTVVPGESVTTAPIITMLAEDAFELIARIPEIDIAKLAVGQPVRMQFDANPDVAVVGTIAFVSPLAIEIDGVAYFEATIDFADTPSWLRSGLNADIDIITDSMSDTLHIPRRFLVTEEEQTYVQIPQGEKNVSLIPVDVLFTGNDGYVAISGVTEGDTIIAP